MEADMNFSVIFQITAASVKLPFTHAPYVPLIGAVAAVAVAFFCQSQKAAASVMTLC
jgi:hypothetical protein